MVAAIAQVLQALERRTAETVALKAELRAMRTEVETLRAAQLGDRVRAQRSRSPRSGHGVLAADWIREPVSVEILNGSRRTAAGGSRLRDLRIALTSPRG